MTNICTSIEQSKKLLELGLNPDTADLWYINGEGNPHIGDWNENSHDWDDIPAWSLSKLLGMIPEYETYKDGKRFIISIGRTIALESEGDETPFDVVFNMMCWLLENKKL